MRKLWARLVRWQRKHDDHRMFKRMCTCRKGTRMAIEIMTDYESDDSVDWTGDDTHSVLVKVDTARYEGMLDSIERDMRVQA